MRFVGALSFLAFGAGTAAFGQDAAVKDQKIQEIERQLAALQAQLNAMKSDAAPSTTPSLDQRLDGAIRPSPASPVTEPRRLNISAPGIEGIDLFGGIGIRGDYWSNFNQGNGQNDVFSVGQEAWLGAHAKASEKTSVGIVLHYNNVWGRDTVHGLGSNGRLTADPSASSSSSANVSVDEAWLNVRDMYNSGIDFTAGRQSIELGSERIIGDDEWRMTRTVFDGFRLDQSLGTDLGRWTLIAVRLQDSDNTAAPVTDLQPVDGHVADNADLYGFFYTAKRNDLGGLDVYIFQLEDPNIGSTAGRTRFTTYGARWTSPSFAGFATDFEGATQFGEFQGNKTHNYGFGTYALHLGVGWMPETKIDFLKGVHAGYDYATGGDGTHPEESFVELYPTLHGWFGITDMFSWTNIQHMTIGTDFDVSGGTLALGYHWNRMASHNGGFLGYNASGVGGAGVSKDLGQEMDAVYSVDCTKSTKVSLGLGYFFPGKGFHQMTGVANDMLYAYLGFRMTF